MRPLEVTSNFTMSYGTLTKSADTMLDLLARDKAEFATRGFQDIKRQAFVASRNRFAEFESDEQLDGLKQQATQDKAVARVALENEMTTIFDMAKNTFGENSGRYRMFGDRDISHQTDEKLVRTGRTMATTAKQFLTELADEGFNAAKLADFTVFNMAFDLSIDAQSRAIRLRDVSTEGRLLAANELYKLITKYAETGKSLFATKSEAKYNDYVLYSAPESGEVVVVPTSGV